LTLITLDNASISLFDPFYPDVAKSRGVDKIELGYIFAVHPLGSMVTSILVGKMMKFWGRKKLMVFGLIVLILTSVI